MYWVAEYDTRKMALKVAEAIRRGIEKRSLGYEDIVDYWQRGNIVVVETCTTARPDNILYPCLNIRGYSEPPPIPRKNMPMSKYRKARKREKEKEKEKKE